MLSDIYSDLAGKMDKVWAHDRSKTVGASEIGQCARQTFWVKNKGTRKGVEEDEGFTHDWGARVRGTVMEAAFWYPAMSARFGDKLKYAGPQQRTFIKGYLSATPDGVLVNQPYDLLKEFGIRNIRSAEVMAECKTIDPRTNLVEAKEVNFFQTQAQMGLVRDLTPFKPEYNLLTYTDASFWSEVDEFPIQFDATVYKAAHERAEQIMTTKHGKDLKPEGWIAGGKECQFCPFTKACGVIRRGVPYNSKEATPQFAAEIEDLAKQANKIKATIIREEKKHKALEQEIKDRLRGKGVKRIPNVVNWYTVAAPVRYKNKEIREQFLELGGDLDEFTSFGEESDRLVIAATPAASRVVKRKPVTRKVKRNLKRKTGNRNRNRNRKNG